MAIVLTIGGVILLGLVTAQGWLILQLNQQNERVLRRIEGVAARVPAKTSAAPMERAPSFDLISLAGPRIALSALLNRGKPLLLVFTDVRCGPCFELLPDIAGWQRVYGERLTIALISSGTIELNRTMTAEYGIQNVLIQDESPANEAAEVARAYGIHQLPAAIVVQPNGARPAQASYGAHAVRNLVAETLGLALPPPTPRETKSAIIGQPIPPLQRPDLDGNIVDFANGGGQRTLVIFWSPGCHHCKELLPEIQSWESSGAGVRTLIVSRGPAGLNREVGFRSPIVLDDDRSIASIFGAQGTPAAVILGARGVVNSSVARGASGVRSLVAQLMTSVSTAN